MYLFPKWTLTKQNCAAYDVKLRGELPDHAAWRHSQRRPPAMSEIVNRRRGNKINTGHSCPFLMPSERNSVGTCNYTWCNCACTFSNIWITRSWEKREILVFMLRLKEILNNLVKSCPIELKSWGDIHIYVTNRSTQFPAITSACLCDAYVR